VQEQVNRSDVVCGTDSYGPKEACIRWGQGWKNPFAATRGDKAFLQSLWSLVIIIVIMIIAKLL